MPGLLADVIRQVDRLGPNPQVRLRDPAVLEQAVRDARRHFDRQRLGLAAAVVPAVDAHHLARGIEQRPTREPLVKTSIGPDQAVQPIATPAALAAPGRHHRAEGCLKLARAANRKDQLARPQVRTGTAWSRGGTVALGLEQGQVGARIVPDDGRAHRLVAIGHRDVVLVLDRVDRGEDVVLVPSNAGGGLAAAGAHFDDAGGRSLDGRRQAVGYLFQGCHQVSLGRRAGAAHQPIR